MKSLHEELRDRPIRPYPCKQCALLKKVSNDPHYSYRCTFWNNFFFPLHMITMPKQLQPTNKQINGPHTDEPPFDCAQFKALGDEGWPT